LAHEFGLVRRLLKEHSGLNLGEDKQDLLEGKLRPLLREFGCPTLSHLVLAMKKPDAHELRSRVAQAVTVQESYFYRDKVPFHYFIDVMLPRLMARREKERRIRVWCAAAAMGQEPYSLAMELAERNGKLAGWTVEIVARLRGGGALQGAQGALQPIRGAERAPRLAAGQIFQQGRQRLGDQPGNSPQGRVPRAQPARR
jgi:chemotaxis protein methyltransferase CheR